ncbi:extracellular medium-chain-length polyhydroxyalkanoate depolymerase [Leptospira sp. GIMC2001]|uniref:extracellular medium-chain-length polyhydroxyalkanoate depolymerase n=1 Tax=Leptospira sp. GIMC2001 TaxID=1513297 RepID=UPI00234A7AAD|nr:plasmid partitioning protein [Leptospira sp. GIMC2001]WCL50169.1 plasmid partitioning protein [Leptospira sp. GIMC2001]
MRIKFKWAMFSMVTIFLVTSSGSLMAARCKTTGFIIKTTSCTHNVTYVQARPGFTRKVKFQVPEGTAPVGGWPVVVIYQGSFYPVEFTRKQGDPFGGYYEVKVIEKLLNNGFAVIAPDAGFDLFWETNLPTIYELTADYIFLNNLFDGIANGVFGNINSNKKFATGISSGGYNTSRMAVSFPGQFKALAVQSGSYATCSGPLCLVPNLPANHPPTLFVHGWLDLIVPWWSMDLYYDKLISNGTPTKKHTDWFASHEWVSSSPNEIYSWFNKYR